MLSAFWLNFIGLLFDTAPYIVLWLGLEVFLHSRLPFYALLPPKLKLWVGLRYALGPLWDKSWYWQIVGVTVFAALALVLPDNIKSMLDLTYDASYHIEWYAVASVAALGLLTLVRVLKRAFPNGGAGCEDGRCSVDGRRG
jgi:hypothetical protein